MILLANKKGHKADKLILLSNCRRKLNTQTHIKN